MILLWTTKRASPQALDVVNKIDINPNEYYDSAGGKIVVADLSQAESCESCKNHGSDKLIGCISNYRLYVAGGAWRLATPHLPVLTDIVLLTA